MGENGQFAKRYRMIRLLGRGGMGQVCLVEDMTDHTQWALKEMPKKDIHRNEVRVLSSLQHKALPKVREVIEEEERILLVMEYMQGRTLQEVIGEKGRLAEARVRNIFLQIVQILCYLHQREHPVAYRDLKPTNLIVDEKDSVKLIDFGIAEEYSEENRSNPKYAALTKGYAAPEQYGKQYAVDVRTDIFALGATMHYLLTGKDPQKPPYKFEPVRKLNRDVSYAMQEIVRKCLQLHPDRRYQSAQLLAEDLRGIDEADKKIRKTNRTKRFIALVGLAAAVMIILGIFFTVRYSRKAEEDNYRRRIEDATELAGTGNFTEAIALAEQLISENPDNSEAYLKKAEIYYIQGEHELCLQYLEYEVMPRFPAVIHQTDFIALTEALSKTGTKNGKE